MISTYFSFLLNNKHTQQAYKYIGQGFLPLDTEPSELKNAIRPGTFFPHVSYTAFARSSRNSCAVITPTKTSVRCEFSGDSCGCKSIISNGARNKGNKNYYRRCSC